MKRKSPIQKLPFVASPAIALRRIQTTMTEAVETLHDCIAKHAQLVQTLVGFIDVVEAAGGVVSSKSAGAITTVSPVDGPALAAAYLQACYALGVTPRHYRKK